MSNTHNWITSDEFSRYVTEEANFRSRLEHRLATDHDAVRKDLGEIKGLVRETNGRVGKAEVTISVLRRDFEAMKSEGMDIEKTVHEIRDEGCSRLSSHMAVLGNVDPTDTSRTINLSVLSRRQKIVAGSGLAIVMWPALQEIARTLHAIVAWLEGHP